MRSIAQLTIGAKSLRGIERAWAVRAARGLQVLGSMGSRQLVTVAFCALAVTSCGGKTPAPSAEPRVDTKASMHEHFVQTRATLPLIVNGQLKAARAKAAGVELAAVPADLREWGPFVDRMRRATKALASTTSIPAAARAFADIAAECGACHKSLGVAVSFEKAHPPIGVGGTKGKMQRHIWAANRLWEGMVAPSDKLWLSGAVALQDAQLEPAKAAPDIESLIKSMAVRVHDLGMKASNAGEPIARARVFGELLGTCAVCHKLQGR